MLRLNSRHLALALLFAGFATNLSAVDGLVLIDQSRALAGTVTPGDTPGFPISITQPGSYRLSGNLTVPSGQSAIVLAAQNISIDLNGFNITTPTQPQAGGATAIVANGVVAPNGLAIRNGRIEGFVTPFALFVNTPAGFQSCRYCVFEDLFLRWGLPGSVASIDLGMFNRVRNVTAPTHNVNVYCPSLVTGTVATGVSMAIDNPGDADTNLGACTFQQNAIGGN
jgi:hypothetical protein